MHSFIAPLFVIYTLHACIAQDTSLPSCQDLSTDLPYVYIRGYFYRVAPPGCYTHYLLLPHFTLHIFFPLPASVSASASVSRSSVEMRSRWLRCAFHESAECRVPIPGSPPSTNIAPTGIPVIPLDIPTYLYPSYP